MPPGDRGDPALAPGPGETLDCLGGHWKLFQLRSGHRYSTDDLLTAWFAASALGEAGQSPGHHLDLGCGIGSVGLLVLWRFPSLHLLGVEAQEVSAALAARSFRYNGVSDRAAVRLGDFRAPGVLAPEERFDLITGSPPYLVSGEARRSDRPQRGPCRFEDRGGAAAYLATAATHLAEGGLVAWVHASRHREANLAAAAAAGLGDLEWREVVFREGRESVITVFRARRGPYRQRRNPALVVRLDDGSWSREYRDLRREMGFPA